MDVFLNKLVATAFILRILFSNQSKLSSFIANRILCAIHKAKDRTSIPIPEAMDFHQILCNWVDDIVNVFRHLITDSSILGTKMKMQIAFCGDSCMFTPNYFFKSF